jgi:HPt (histidine-containing phosphotransfer) domain-containing protein
MPEISKYFILDAESAIKVIADSLSVIKTADTTPTGDIKTSPVSRSAKLHASDAKAVDSYVTAVHGMKNVLANIGETELSAAALRLEQAGNKRDLALITKETPAFTDALMSLIDKHKTAHNDETTEISGKDTVYLRDKLSDIKTACQTFDITTAKKALDDLRQKTWPRYVNETLDEISVHLLHSAFKKAAAAAENTAFDKSQ